MIAENHSIIGGCPAKLSAARVPTPRMSAPKTCWARVFFLLLWAATDQQVHCLAKSPTDDAAVLGAARRTQDTSSKSAPVATPSDDLFEQAADVFQSRCLSCHQDSVGEGDFSMSTFESTMKEGYIVPADLESSRLWEAVKPRAGKAEMPKDGEPLSDMELDAIKQWILAGAKWPKERELHPAAIKDLSWWSFRPIHRPEIPKIELTGDSASLEVNPVDAFIQSELLQRGLSPSKRADRRTLLRRLKFDLLGLPPTKEEMDEFLADDDPKAYGNWVERFLASPHYGERWARHWLDVAKYADTCGYDKDKLRENAWPYRDYVIRSMNQDKPYRQFIREQVAGDILYPGQADGVLGLGFIAAGPWDFIGHVEVPESKLDGKVARNLDRDDMVSGVFNTFCSLTVQCARCHHHKFDPISQQQYYSLQSIFAAVDRAERPYEIDPDLEHAKQELHGKISDAKTQIEALEKEIRADGGELLVDLDQRYSELKDRVAVKKDPRFGYHSQLAKTADEEKWVEVDLGGSRLVATLEVLPCHDEYADIGAGFGFPVRYQIQVFADENDQEGVVVADRSEVDQPNPGLQSLRIELDEPREIQRVRVTAIKLMERANDYHLALAEIKVLGVDQTNHALGCEVRAIDSIEAPVRWGKSNLTDGKWAEYLNRQLAGEFHDVKQQRDQLLAKIQSPDRMAQKERLQQRVKDAEAEIKKIPEGKLVYAAATHFKSQGNFKPTSGVPRTIHVLARGEIGKPLEVASPSLLKLAEPLPTEVPDAASEAERRAALARWLTHDDHPLVWRSIVNRIWLYHFGQAIVKTPNDFGKMGALPSHPELLDWLAVEFRDGGRWVKRGSIKDLHRLMVTSDTYQQVSDHDEAKARTDSSNETLWRMNRRRLEAEEIRDAIMFVSGALDPTMGGPGYRLFELERPEHSPHYEYHKFDHSDPATHRRSIYRFIVRSQPDPWMTTMDCADSSQSTPKRDETLTALQSLSLLNNQFNLVMAEKFQKSLQGRTEMLTEQVAIAFEDAVQRQASQEDLQAMVAYAQQHGMANLCRFLFNLSEFIYID